jgi:hypothetical protein
MRKQAFDKATENLETAHTMDTINKITTSARKDNNTRKWAEGGVHREVGRLVFGCGATAAASFWRRRPPLLASGCSRLAIAGSSRPTVPEMSAGGFLNVHVRRAHCAETKAHLPPAQVQEHGIPARKFAHGSSRQRRPEASMPEMTSVEKR